MSENGKKNQRNGYLAYFAKSMQHHDSRIRDSTSTCILSDNFIPAANSSQERLSFITHLVSYVRVYGIRHREEKKM